MNKCRKNRFRKAMSVLLSAVLVIGMASGALPAEVCASEGEHTHDGYTAWTKTDSLPTVAGNYYLTEDVTLSESEQWEVPAGTTNLCLNGKTIRKKEYVSTYLYRYVIYIPSSAQLNLYDCLGEGKITSSGRGNIPLGNFGTFCMYGGEISGNISGFAAGGVTNNGTFYMYGGKICDNVGDSSTNSGGVYNKPNATFYMYGGEIRSNIAKSVGGVTNAGTFYMYDGKISDNGSSEFGGVLNYTTFYMYGGEISSNNGGGVQIGSFNGVWGTMTIGGSAVIRGNKDKSGLEKNICMRKNVDVGGKIMIDSDNPLCGTAKIGITIEDEQPTEEVPIPFIDGNDQDYSSYFYSDNEEYVVTDSPSHAVLLGVKHKHTQDVESWNHDVDSHWKECSKCGDKFEEAAHTFGDWVTDSESTETEDGEKHRDCSVCGFQETETIPAIRPTSPPTSSPTPAPTETPAPMPPATEKPTPTPTATEEPSATLKPVATKQPTISPEPAATEKPLASPKPAVTEQPSATEKPPATEQPSATPKPMATKQPPVTEKPSATSKPAATKQPSATLKPEETKQPPATKHPMATEKPSETVRPGEIWLEVEVRGNAPATRVSTSVEEMADRILTAEDRKELETGQDISIYVVVTDISGSVSDADRALAETVSASYMTGQYLDISLYKEVGGKRSRITGLLAGNLSLTLAVPHGLKNTDSTKTREFAVARVHDGEAAMLPDKDSDADTVTVDTDRFSTYEIVYRDTAAGNNTGTGNANGSTGGNQNNTGSPNGGSQPGVPGSTGETVNNGRTGGNTNVSSEKESESGSSKKNGDNQSDSKDSRDRKSGSSATGHTRDGEPKTGDGAPLEMAATLAMISGLSYVLLYFLERRRGMTEEMKKEITARIIAWAKKGGRLRKGIAIAAIFVFLVYYHSIGKEVDVEWREAYDE